MNAFTRLLALPEPARERRGIRYTAAEIGRQPDVWPAVAEVLLQQRRALQRFLEEAGFTGDRQTSLILAGAGSSEYIGNAVWPALRRRLAREVLSYPTTHLVTHPQAAFLPGRSYGIVSFSRSGESPESLAAWHAARRLAPEVRHLVITCDAAGSLARLAAGDPRSFCLVLPPQTNDRSLVMTSAFTSMALAAFGIALLDTPERLTALASTLSAAAGRVLGEYGDLLKSVADRPFDRACFLGSGTLYGAAQEAALKMTELNAGKVAAIFNSFLGIRHGPQVFIGPKCLVVACLASDERVRRYELDLLRELRAKKQGLLVLGICAQAEEAMRGLCDELIELAGPVEDDYRVITDIVACQVLALFKSLRNRLRPDNPSAEGIIHRVVQGVTIYEP